MRVAILDSDPTQSSDLMRWLGDEGHQVYTFPLADAFMRVFQEEVFDFILMAQTLPDMPGISVLEWLRGRRKDDTPVIFMTADYNEGDASTVLSAGADDCLVKPLRRLELLSRISAILRRVMRGPNELELHGYCFDLQKRVVTLNGRKVELTEKEFDLGVFLFRNIGRTISRGHLLEAVWGRNPDVPTRTVDSHISRLRKKLGLQDASPLRLLTTYKFGYRLERMPQGMGIIA
ncbi:MAG: response regulator transcription factor [Zoogloea sp.]|nr:response regulator transcription factor [Zoogloea sp.]